MFKINVKLIRFAAVAATLLSMASLANLVHAHADTPEIVYSFPAGSGADLGAVQDALNAVVTPKIGATVKLNPIDWGTYEQKMKLAFAAGESCDITFTAQWINNYTQNVANGNLLALDDLLTKATPKLYASMPPAIWDGSRVNGKIYQVTTEIMWPKDFGFYVRKDLAEKYKLDLSTIKTYADLEPFLQTLKDKEPGLTPAYLESQAFGNVSLTDIAGYDGGIDGNGGVIADVRYDDKSLKAIPLAFTPEYKAFVDLQYKWSKAGFFPKDLQSRDDTDAQMKAGKFGVQLDRVIKPGSEAEEKGIYGYDWLSKDMATSYFYGTDSVTAGFAICAATKHPQEALKFLELLHTDEVTFNIVAHGIEGKHWEFIDKAKKLIGFPSGVTVKTTGYNPAQGWMWGNQFLEYYIDPAQVGAWDLTKTINAKAQPSVALGFSLNPDPIKNELAQLSSVHTQYALPLQTGLVDPATGLPAYQAKLKEAGLDKVLTEIQKQLDAWSKAKSAS